MNIIERVINDGPNFCPRCGTPVTRSMDEDDSRLCETCEWYGDRTETTRTPPVVEKFDPELVIAQSLELYRAQCRRELVLEQAYAGGAISDHDMKQAKQALRTSTRSIVELFVSFTGDTNDTNNSD